MKKFNFLESMWRGVTANAGGSGGRMASERQSNDAVLTLEGAYIEHPFSIDSAYIGTTRKAAGKMLKIAAMMCLLLTLSVGNAWGGQYVYDFSTKNKWFTSSERNTNVSTGSGNNYTSVYDLDGIEWTAGGTNYYFSSSYYMLGKTNAYLNLPTYTDEKITSIVIHSSSGHSQSVSVNIYTTGNTAASTGLTWSTKSADYVYAISASYQASALRVKVTNKYNTQFTRITINTAKNSSCAGTQLATPNVSSTPSNGQIQLTWPAVTNATKYQVSWNGGSFVDATSPFTKTSLTNGTAYTWAVRAVGNGSTYCTSEAFEGSTKPGSTVYTITWKVNGETYATTKVASGDHLMLPASPSSCEVGKVFAGWSATNIGSTPTDTKPTFVSSQTTPAGTTTYYAVFATRTANSYSLGDINDLFPGQTTLIVNATNNKALSDEYVSSNEDKRLQKVDVTITSSKITSMSNSHLIWTVANSGQKYNFTTGTGNLRTTCTGNDKLSCKPGSDPWTLTAANTGTYYMNSNISGTSRLEYYSTGDYFTTYGTNGTGAAYEMSFFVPTCTQYFTTCAVACSDPTINTHPTGGVTYAKNAVATALSVSATKNGSGPDLTYQWYSNTTDNNTTGTEIDGATSSSYTPPTTSVGTKYYYCIVSSGTCTATSNTASVTVTGPVITVSETTLAFGIIDNVVGQSYTRTFTVSGTNLQSDVTITKSTSDPKHVNYSIDKTTIAQTAGSISPAVTVTVTFTPTTTGLLSVSNLFSITSTNAETKYVSVTGAGKWKATFCDAAGGEHAASYVLNGNVPTKPGSNPTSCSATSTTFIGWTQTKWNGTKSQSEVDALTTAATKVYTSSDDLPALTSNITYYPVFAKSSGGSSGSFNITASDITTGPASYTASETTFTKLSTNDIGYKNVSYNNKNTPTDWAAQQRIQFKKDASAYGELYNKVAIDGLTKIRIYDHSGSSNLTIYTGTTSKATTTTLSWPGSATGTEDLSIPKSTSGTLSFTSSYYDFTVSNSHTFFYIKNGNTAIAYPMKIVVYYSTVTYSEYLTTCCDSYAVTLTGSGVVDGGTFSASSMQPCVGSTVELSATLCSGYTQGAWTVAKTGTPATTVTVTNNQFTMPSYAVTVSLATTAKVDHFIDKMHSTDGYTGDGAERSGCNYTVPNISNTSEPVGSNCDETHYIFVGWVDADHVGSNGALLSGYSIIAGNSTQNATGTSYYAIWAQAE